MEEEKRVKGEGKEVAAETLEGDGEVGVKRGGKGRGGEGRGE